MSLPMAGRVDVGGDEPGLLGVLQRASGPAVFAVTAALYFGIARFIVWLDDPIKVGAGFWPAAGVTLAIMLVVPTRRWPWVVGAIVAAEVVNDVIQGYPVAGIPWWVAGNVIDPLLGAALIRGLGTERGHLVPLRNLLMFLAFGVTIGPVVGASVGSVGTVTHTDLGWVDVWPKYVVGDALGVLVVAPVILTIRRSVFRRRLLESIGLGTGLVAISMLTLWNWPGSLELISPSFVVPLLAWSALRFGIKGAAWGVFLFAQLTNVITALGDGPFVDLAVSNTDAVTLLQIFLIIAASSTFVLAALVSEMSDRQEVERLLHQMADSMPQLVWVARDDGSVEYYNRRQSAYDGLAPGVGTLPWESLVHPDDRQRTLADWRAATAAGAPYETEYRMRMADGSYRWHLARAERVVGIGGAQWYGTSTDIHDLKTADELKDQFIAIASHELRNPVGAIHGMAQQMKRSRDRGALNAERLEAYTNSLLDSSAYLARLTRDLMDVSRLQRGTLPLHPEPADVAALVRSVVASDEWPAGRVRAEVRGVLGTVVLDPARVRQVLSNLVDNALKYSPPDEPVDVIAESEGDGVLVRVVDRGIGVPAEALELIFDPFGRAANTGMVAGLGMGLYVAREIAERHQGRLWATSDGEGRGTTMCLWLPASAVGQPSSV